MSDRDLIKRIIKNIKSVDDINVLNNILDILNYGANSQIAISDIAYMKLLMQSKKNKIDTKVFLAYVVPEAQPIKSSQAYIHGGYHITLFPETELPSDYNILAAMHTFKISKIPWTLPKNAKLILNKNNYDSIWLKNKTLSQLMDHLQNPTGVWNPETRWEPLHLTLSDHSDYDKQLKLNVQNLYEIFNNESSWYVQLVERIPKGDNPKNKLDYEYRWLKNQRIRLYTSH